MKFVSTCWYGVNLGLKRTSLLLLMTALAYAYTVRWYTLSRILLTIAAVVVDGHFAAFDSRCLCCCGFPLAIEYMYQTIFSRFH